MIYPRKYTAAEWAERNVTLKNGEFGIEKDTKKRKMGDGHTRWNELPYEFNQAVAASLFASKGAGSGSSLIEDPNDPGTFLIQ